MTDGEKIKGKWKRGLSVEELSTVPGLSARAVKMTVKGTRPPYTSDLQKNSAPFWESGFRRIGMKEENKTSPAEEKPEMEERFAYLWNLVFGEVPEPSEKVKGRAVRPETPLDPMCYVPVSSDDSIPREVIDERLSLLGEDDRAVLRKEFDSGRDPLGMFLYFGGKPFPTDRENASAAMTRICAYVGGDVETTIRLFKACPWATLAFTEEDLYAMAREAVDFVKEFRDTMAKINKPTFGYDKRIGLSRYGSRKKHY